MISQVIFAPRSYQRAVQDAFRAGIRRFVTVWHRRAGKDKTWLAITLEAMMKRKGVYFHIFPSLNQGRRDIWDNIDADGNKFIDMFPEALVAARNETEMQITLVNGSIWQIMGADDLKAIARLRGPNPIGLVFSEYAHMMPEAWETLSPVLAENGGWAAFAYTPAEHLPANGVDHGHERYERARANPDWFCSYRTVDDTRRDGAGENGERVVSESAIAAERADGKSENYIRREYYCAFGTPVEGAYYGEALAHAERDGRICSVPYDVSIPVHTAWDLGAQTLTMAVGCFQLVGPVIRWIDCLSERDIGIPSYMHELREKRSYVYGRWFVPHDANAHEIGSGKTRVETMRILGARDITVVQKLSPADGIADVLRLFPKMWFDRIRCAPLLSALRKYHEEHGRPKHDDASHYADMVRTMAVGLKEPRPRPAGMRGYAQTTRDVYAQGMVGSRYAKSNTVEYSDGATQWTK